MVNVNFVMIGGHLTRDPELKYLPSGAPVCDFSIAVNKKWTDKKTGEKKESVSFVGVVAFGKTAEMCAEYLKKGVPALVEGEIKQDRWEDKDGKKRDKTKVEANRVHFLGRKSEEPLVVAEKPETDGGL